MDVCHSPDQPKQMDQKSLVLPRELREAPGWGGGGRAQGNLSLIPVPVGKGGLLVPPRRF